MAAPIRPCKKLKDPFLTPDFTHLLIVGPPLSTINLFTFWMETRRVTGGLTFWGKLSCDHGFWITRVLRPEHLRVLEVTEFTKAKFQLRPQLKTKELYLWPSVSDCYE